jgi:hypothetical protein
MAFDGNWQDMLIFDVSKVDWRQSELVTGLASCNRISSPKAVLSTLYEVHGSLQVSLEVPLTSLLGPHTES